MTALLPMANSESGWEASLELGFERRGERTVLARRAHRGPLRVQRPFYPEGGELCHVYVLHPPGGMVGGDSLDIRAELEHGARALLTTPAATKFYRSKGRRSRQRVTIRVARAAACEWLPQETIVFGGALAEGRTRVLLESGALFAGWEIVCLGRPAAQDHFDTGEYRSSFELYRGGEPLWLDRCSFLAQHGVLTANWGLRGCSVVGTFVMSATEPALIERIRALGLGSAHENFAVSAASGVIACRFAGSSCQRALGCFSAVWREMRPFLWGRPASVPRIWLT